MSREHSFPQTVKLPRSRGICDLPLESSRVVEFVFPPRNLTVFMKTILFDRK